MIPHQGSIVIRLDMAHRTPDDVISERFEAFPQDISGEQALFRARELAEAEPGNQFAFVYGWWRPWLSAYDILGGFWRGNYPRAMQWDSSMFGLRPVIIDGALKIRLAGAA
jgi:hypothetical protein